MGLKEMGQGRIQEFGRGGGLNFFLSMGAQHSLGMHENPLNSIDFTCPGGLVPIAPPPEYAPLDSLE